jgi:TonB family protein
MRHAILALSALPALIAAPVQAEIVMIPPSSPWNVDFGENKCRLARFFGEGEDRHLAFFEQYWPDESFGLTVAGPQFKRFRSRASTQLRFADEQPLQDTNPFTGTIGEYGSGVVYSSASLVAKDEEADESAMRFEQLDLPSAKGAAYVGLKQRGDEIRLMTGPLDEAFAVLNRCTSDLVAAWGLDPEQHRSATKLPVWTNRDAVVRRIVSLYPRNALNMGEQGIMRMRVIVGTDGAVEDCTILKATDTEKLESPACEAMKKATFTPALDAAGKPMRSYYVSGIVYQI